MVCCKLLYLLLCEWTNNWNHTHIAVVAQLLHAHPGMVFMSEASYTKLLLRGEGDLYLLSKENAASLPAGGIICIFLAQQQLPMHECVGHNPAVPLL
jgi:hypothetical protein